MSLKFLFSSFFMLKRRKVFTRKYCRLSQSQVLIRADTIFHYINYDLTFFSNDKLCLQAMNKMKFISSISPHFYHNLLAHFNKFFFHLAADAEEEFFLPTNEFHFFYIMNKIP